MTKKSPPPANTLCTTSSVQGTRPGPGLTTNRETAQLHRLISTANTLKFALALAYFSEIRAQVFFPETFRFAMLAALVFGPAIMPVDRKVEELWAFLERKERNLSPSAQRRCRIAIFKAMYRHALRRP